MASPPPETQLPSDGKSTIPTLSFCPSSSPRAPSPSELDQADGHVAHGRTPVPACQCSAHTGTEEMQTCEAPRQLHTLTWSTDQRIYEVPHQQQNHHHHHHHHHHYHHQWAASGCCPPSELSSFTPSLQNNVEFLFPSTHAHVYPSKHTQIGPPVCTCIAHILPSSSLRCIEQTENVHKLAPSISPCQQSAHPPVDLYATPTFSSKRTKRPRTLHVSKLFPPLPSPASPPYVLCQHCFQLLALPLHPLDGIIHSAVFKLKCALCLRTSFFSMRQRHALNSLSHADQMGAISAKDSGEFRFKEDMKSMGEAEPIIISSGVSNVEAGQRLLNADVYLPADGEIEQVTEEGNRHKHGGTIDASKVVQTRVPPDTPAVDVSREERCQLGDDMNTGMCISGTLGDSSSKGTSSQHHGEPPYSSPKLNPEFAGFSTVQDWVNSLEHGGFSHCPTPVMGARFGSELPLQQPLDWRIDDQHANDMVVLPVPGSPLHEHFGYKSARELLHKTCSSDDEIKAHSDSNSSPSTSNASANTFKPPGFDTVAPLSRSSLKKPKSNVKISTHVEQENQTSLANLLKRSFKGFGERKRVSVSNSKPRVVVNGHALTELAVKRAEERAGKLRPGTYWYDSMAGFWGTVGGPCLGVLPPFIEELHYSMAGDCSNGDTQVFVNGRELHHKDLTLLSHRGLSKKPGRAYVVGFDGVVIDEASGQELKHLGKFAPTVEKRGKGFGMYMEKSR